MERKLFLLGMSFVLCLVVSSCDRDNSSAGTDDVSTRMATLSVSVSGVAEEDASTELDHSSSVSRDIQVSVDDGGNIDASLERTSFSTRSTSALGSGIKYRVIAFQQGKVTSAGYVSHGDFEVGGNNSLESFHVPVGQNYTFVCYSLGSNDPLPAFNVKSLNLAFSSPADLLYSKFNQAITSSSSNLSIVFSHRFSKISIIADASGVYKKNVTAISASLNPVYVSGTLILSNGSLEASSSSSSRNIAWKALKASVVTSNSYFVFTGGASTLTINIPSVTIGNIKRSNLNATFSTALLKPGQSYTLRFKFQAKRLVWAGSNIYWNGKKLTFDASVSANSDLKQGVFFHWGSLIGVSASASNGGTATDFASSTLYVPSYRSGAPGSSTWSSGSPSSKGYNNWKDIPGYYLVYIYSSDKSGSFLNEAVQNTPANYAAYKGDICKYLSTTGAVSGKWRMPTASELGEETPSNAWSAPWTKFGRFAAVGRTAPEGTTVLSSGATYDYFGFKTRFPASGFRDYAYGVLTSVGQMGEYWSCTAENNQNFSSRLYFDTSKIRPGLGAVRKFGYLVRCVQE